MAVQPRNPEVTTLAAVNDERRRVPPTSSYNPGRVLRTLFSNGPMTRAELARALALTRAAMTELAGGLIETGLVEEHEAQELPSRGRPGRLMRIRPEAAHFFGAEIGVERLVVTAIDLGGTVVARAERRGSLAGVPLSRVLDDLSHLVDGLRRQHPVLATSRGLGVSVPGFMRRDGIVLAAPLLGWRDVDIITALRRHFDEPVLVENDANATAHGEWHFVPEHRDGDLLAVVLAHGVGCGVVAEGRILRGAHGLAGELGHMMIAGSNSDVWECRVGLSAVRRGDEMPDDWPTLLAQGLATATYAYDPETIVIAGELTDMFKGRQEEVTAEYKRLLVPGFPLPKLTAARFGADGCAIGAASLKHAMFLDQREIRN